MYDNYCNSNHSNHSSQQDNERKYKTKSERLNESSK